jgi:hypothetical protein
MEKMRMREVNLRSFEIRENDLKSVCHCERSEAIAPERNPNSAAEQVRLLRYAHNDKCF